MNHKSWTVKISNWVAPDERAAEVLLWPIGWNSLNHPELADRVGLSLGTGSANVSLNLTADECMKLAWALIEASTHGRRPLPAAPDKARVLAHLQANVAELQDEATQPARGAA